ncbi:MAG TPA: DUF2326 domain-containing protein [Cellvibrio sp.]|nr:DUF2326 domain-containing protein [Cellvibrio sp.]
MIKLNRLYSNNKEIFPDIEFHDGVNVVFASVTQAINNKSSHSLGKTTLIDIIDFCLLKQIPKEHILKKEVFSNFSFYLEIKVSEKNYTTIRRPSEGKISITTNSIPIRFEDDSTSNWELTNLSLAEAKKKLNSIICPEKLKRSGFTYRNGLRYCLRKQTQYENTFKVNNSRESDSSWVPYIASTLGINSETITKKYEANVKVEALKNAIKEIKSIPTESSQSLEAEITQLDATISRMKIELNNFDFKRTDENISSELINEVSSNISTMLSRAYSLDQKLSAIDKSLKATFTFEIEKVIDLFREVNIYFPDELTKSYEELIELNKNLSAGRNERLISAKKSIIEDRDAINMALENERRRQQNLTQILLQKDAFEKYKKLQERASKEESRLAVLEERLERIDLTNELGEKLEAAEREKTTLAKLIEPMTKVRGNDVLSTAVLTFSELVENILGISAFFYIETNKEGNLQFKIGLKDQTSLNQGYSYTRVLSAIFDITLLIINSKNDFYRFCYHDGILESLDDRIKVKLIDEWRKKSSENKLQFIITVLDSDLPIINEDKKYFEKNEVIRELHDRGATGRLFRMEAF